MGTKVSPLSSLFDRVGAFSVEMFAFNAEVAIAYDRATLTELATLSARAHGGLEESGVRMPMAQSYSGEPLTCTSWTIQAHTYQTQAPISSEVD